MKLPPDIKTSVYFFYSPSRLLNINIFHFQITGDGSDEEMAAKSMNFPFWRITSHSDLQALNNALDMQFI